MLEPIKPTDIKQEKPKDQRKFIVIPYRVLKDKRFTIQRLRAYMTICSYANHKGNLWPSVDKLAEDMGITQPTMQSHIRWLTENGYLMTINDSYTVGKSAKPRAIVYDPDNPPNPDDWRKAQQDIEQVEQESKTTIEQRVNLIESMQSSEEVKAKPASLYRVWQEALAVYGVSHPYEKDIYQQLSHRYTLEGFKKATGVLIKSSGRPPASVKIMLRS